MRIFLFLIITSFLTTGCDLNNFDNSYKPSNKLKLANEIRKKVATNLKEKYDLQPCGSGGQMMHEIKMLALSFNYYKPININEARKILVIAVDEFKDVINADERIHPYLFNYPFEAKNIQIQIVIRNTDGSKIDTNKLCAISLVDGILEYLVRDSKSMLLTTIHKETYEGAMQKLDDASSHTSYLNQKSQH